RRAEDSRNCHHQPAPPATRESPRPGEPHRQARRDEPQRRRGCGCCRRNDPRRLVGAPEDWPERRARLLRGETPASAGTPRVAESSAAPGLQLRIEGHAMKVIKYGKYTGEPADAVDLNELLKRLGDFFLQSGFESQYYGLSEFENERSSEALREMLKDPGAMNNEEIRELIDKLMERLAGEGYINPQQAPQVTPPQQTSALGQVGQPQERNTEARFEITDKTIDFLGFKTLQDLLGSLGRSSLGRHDTRDLSTGVESGGISRAYEFGDTLNLDVSGTLFNAVRRDGARVPIELDYPDLMVHQAEYQSSSATVLMLDCSHSMILYGEDRFTPAKKVALALSHLIRTQYPGDSLHLVLFHDSAEEMPLGELARVQVGPYYTNTREGLRLARRILSRQKKDMKQIVMITDGKPSALTLDDGRIYKNAFGLDPLVVSQTLEEVSKCK